jgi:hypothetical protein
MSHKSHAPRPLRSLALHPRPLWRHRQVVQGFYPRATIGGAAHILGRTVTRVDAKPDPAARSVGEGALYYGPGGFEETLTCYLVISNGNHIPPELKDGARHVVVPRRDSAA